MVKDLETHMAAAAAATIDPPPRKIVMKHDDIIGEVPLEVMNITLRFANLPPQEIQCIFYNKFKPINLYRLRPMQRIRFNTFQDKERIGIEYGILRLQKTSSIYNNFRKSFHEVQLEAFHNYTIILLSLIRKETPDFHTAFAEFYSNIYELSTVYEWQHVILPIAIKAHS